MKAIFPDGKGFARLGETNEPKPFENGVLCRVTHSLISSGTERDLISAANGRSFEEIQSNNARLGYTGAGVVEEPFGDGLAFSRGDKVAFYGGPYVSHSERVIVPRNLLCKIPLGVSSAEAAFGGIGAIAMHALRKARLQLGEVCFVAGAGIIGNIAAQMAMASGCRVVLSDPLARRRDQFVKAVTMLGEWKCADPNTAEETVKRMSSGRGADACLLCVSCDNPEPIEQALRCVRSGGRIIIVGVFDITIPRAPMFKTEAEIIVSRAGGPGRYDVNYEKDGVDYPAQYARWTEGRNLEETLRLLSTRQLNVEPLIDGRFPIAEAEKAFELLMSNSADNALILEW